MSDSEAGAEGLDGVVWGRDAGRFGGGGGCCSWVEERGLRVR